MGLVVEGLSFHVGSQCTNFENYVQALQLSANIIKEAETRTGQKIRILDIGGGFPVKYHPEVKSLRTLAKKLNTEIKRLFPPDMQILAEPGQVPGGKCLHAGRKSDRESIPRREALLLYQRRRLPHLFRAGL